MSIPLQIRLLLRRPFLPYLVVVVLAAGFGPTLAVFNLVDALLFRSLGVDDEASLLRIQTRNTRTGDERLGMSLPIYRDYAAGVPALSGMALFREGIAAHVRWAGSSPSRRSVSSVTVNFFELLGVRPSAGRLFLEHEQGMERPVLVSERFLTSVSSSDEDALGRTVWLNGAPLTIVGVIPARFLGLELRNPPEMWIRTEDIGVAEPLLAGQLEQRSLVAFQTVARLRKGVETTVVQPQLDTLALRLGATESTAVSEDDETPREPWLVVRTIADASRGKTTSTAQVIAAATGATLLVAVINACALVAGWSMARRREVEIRAALGAEPRVLRWERVVEAAFLAFTATILAVVVAASLLALLGTSLPQELLAAREAVGFWGGARGVALMAVIPVAALLALAAANLVGANTGGRILGQATTFANTVRPTLGAKIGSAFAIGQIAIATFLLATAFLMQTTLRKVGTIDWGLSTAPVATASVDLARDGYSKEDANRLLDLILTARTGASTAIIELAGTTSVPPSSGGTTITLRGKKLQTGFVLASENYFSILGIRVVAGRAIERGDVQLGASPVVMVNTALANRLWPGQQNVVGQRLDGYRDIKNAEVVGVVNNIRSSASDDRSVPILYAPLQVHYATFPSLPPLVLIAKTRSTSPQPLILSQHIQEVARDATVFRSTTLSALLGAQQAQQRTVASLLSVLGGIVVLVAAGGVFALLSNTVESRQFELAIRLSLGARVHNFVLEMLMWLGGITGLGVGIGLGSAVLLARALSSLLYGVSPSDGMTLAKATVVVIAMAAVAGFRPILRTARSNPATLLRVI